ncbi:paraquat-inducible protein A [Pikeienuella sp. HZG-20]|uniref:paraquat-inducible protein A n=1 Tax=Paludibacillus litoralis TaxID=3133267 RepID=UPI0030EF8D98
MNLIAREISVSAATETVLKAFNLALLVLYPIAWAAPLARARILPFFSGTELTILGGVRDLWRSDPALAVLVALFAIGAPYLKTILLALVQFGALSGAGWSGVLVFMGKLSMTDVFLLALYIVVVKGVGVGHVETAWGLWFFTGLVLASFGLALAAGRSRGR